MNNVLQFKPIERDEPDKLFLLWQAREYSEAKELLRQTTSLPEVFAELNYFIEVDSYPDYYINEENHAYDVWYAQELLDILRELAITTGRLEVRHGRYYDYNERKRKEKENETNTK